MTYADCKAKLKINAAAMVALLLCAIFCLATVPTQAQELPKIAVYVTGDVPENEKKVLGTHILASLVNSGRYKGIERSSSFLAEIDKEQTKQRSGAIDDSQISELGKQFGVKFVCIADITPALGSYQVSARIVDVKTAEVAFIGAATSPLRNIDDLGQASDQVVKNMFGEHATQARVAKPEPPSAATTVEQIVITSTPNGASVEVNGRWVGTTPHTFKPTSWGNINIAVSMNGYERATRTVGFGGGTVKVPFTLLRASAPQTPQPQPTTQQPPAASPGASGASVFIATLPPKVEVYIGDKLVGFSNEGELQVPVGTHQVRFVKDGIEKTETLTFYPGKNSTRFVNLK